MRVIIAAAIVIFSITLALLLDRRLHAATNERQDQYAVMVYDRQCLSLDKDARYEAPMVNGEPDWKRGTLKGLTIQKQTCGHYEVRKVK